MWLKTSELWLFFTFFLSPFTKLWTFTQINSLAFSLYLLHHFYRFNASENSQIYIPSPDLSHTCLLKFLNAYWIFSPRYFKIISNQILILWTDMNPWSTSIYQILYLKFKSTNIYSVISSTIRKLPDLLTF